jgi:DNA-directed RNA polymerase subunit RPC12/RpoP
MTRGKKGGHPSERPTKMLRVIPEPAAGTRSVLKFAEEISGACITGAGGARSVDYACGTCGRILIEAWAPSQSIVNIVLVCPGCGSYNDTGGAPELN